MESTKDIRKAAEERTYFKLFAEKAGLNLVDAEFESRDEPEPDILYKHGSEATAFELSNCLEQEIQSDIGKRKNGKGQLKPFWADLDHCVKVLENKLRKPPYQSQYPVELLLHYGRSGQNCAAADDMYAGKLSNFLKDWILKETVQFRRIWYLDELDAHLLFSSIGEAVYAGDSNSGY